MILWTPSVPESSSSLLQHRGFVSCQISAAGAGGAFLPVSADWTVSEVYWTEFISEKRCPCREDWETLSWAALSLSLSHILFFCWHAFRNVSGESNRCLSNLGLTMNEVLSMEAVLKNQIIQFKSMTVNKDDWLFRKSEADKLAEMTWLTAEPRSGLDGQVCGRELDHYGTAPSDIAALISERPSLFRSKNMHYKKKHIHRYHLHPFDNTHAATTHKELNRPALAFSLLLACHYWGEWTASPDWSWNLVWALYWEGHVVIKLGSACILSLLNLMFLSLWVSHSKGTLFWKDLSSFPLIKACWRKTEQ